MDYQFLNLVERPARYIGREINSLTKDWTSSEIRICFAFPELYELGMSNLGWRLLYEVVNSQREYLAERVFAPKPDLEQALRRKNIPLASLETNTPLSKFDIIGVTLASELSYINLLTLLSLAGIPLKSEERSEDDPLVIAGGSGAFTPEPMADFCDAFLVGEGEEAIVSILKVIQETRWETRLEKMRALSRLSGIYVPGFCEPRYGSDGLYLGLFTKEENLPVKIRKVTVSDFERAPFPERWLIPYLPVTHDRISVEIMRGCTNRCRFCQARTIYGPCRIRSPQKIFDLVKNGLEKTGYEEVSLLSLSTGDYPYLSQLRELLDPLCREKNVKISFPSMRFDTLSIPAARMEKGKKSSALTFAPESSERRREWLGKKIKNKELLDQARQARNNGWQHIKLYFMLGIPGETEEDLNDIAGLVDALAGIINLNLSFNTFIPKPHTPLERNGMAGESEIVQKVSFIKDRLKKGRNLSLSFHPYKQSFVEGLLSRADRGIGKVLLSAWRKGARFDGWSEYFRFDLWDEALKEAETDTPAILGNQPENVVLPWNHIVI